MKYTKAFKTLLKASKDKDTFLTEVPFRRQVPVVAGNEPGGYALGERDALFVMTDSRVDREGDVILSRGVDVEQFSEFGSILWGHRADEPQFVLGRPAEVHKGDSEILVRAEFFSAEINQNSERVLRMIQAKGLRAMSVGLLIREYYEANDRSGRMPLNIVKSELIETSVTPIPVNPGAVALAVGGSDEEKQAIADMLTEATDDTRQLAASADVSGLSELRIKELVKETVDLLLAKHTVYSIPAKDTAIDALNFFTRGLTH